MARKLQPEGVDCQISTEQGDVLGRMYGTSSQPAHPGGLRDVKSNGDVLDEGGRSSSFARRSPDAGPPSGAGERSERFRRRMAGWTGLEPAVLGVTGRRSG